MKRYAMVAATVLLAACGGDDDKDPTGPGGSVSGSFTATVSGDATASLSGYSGHAGFPAEQGEPGGFIIAMDDTLGTVQGAILFGKQGSAVPGAGTYDIVADGDETTSDWAMLGVLTDSEGGEWLCGGTGGSITVSSATAQRVRGSFNATADCVSVDDGETEMQIAIAGNYDSRGGIVPSSVRLLKQSR